MGYHVREIPFVAPTGEEVLLPKIEKDGGTGAWRDAKKVVRQWYLNKAKQLRQTGEKDYFTNA
jgi:hypothetical protein